MRSNEELQPPHPVDSSQAALLIDAHVHCHRGFEIGAFLDHAEQNFLRAARELGCQGRVVGLLALTEGPGEDSFRRLRDGGRRTQPSGWRVEGTEEEVSLVARRGGEMPLALLAGQQIRLRGGLELLAIGVKPGLAEGGELEPAMREVRASGALAVLPWGFGKWWLRRGRIVDGLLDTTPPEELLMADNGTRAALSREPRLLAKARRLGFRVVAGSDPLPLAGEIARPGSFGCLVEGPFSLRTPAASLRRLLAAGPPPRIFGRRRPLRLFLRDQIAMQLRKRRR